MQASNRAARILAQFKGVQVEDANQLTMVPTAGKNTVTITDNRTGKTFDIDIKNGTVECMKFWNEAKLRVYDPAFKNTASATSRITYIDGPKGILLYRGIPIEQLAAKSNFLEVSFLLIYGVLPSQNQLDYFSGRVMRHTYIHEDLKAICRQFRHNAHPMSMMISLLSAMSTLHPEGNPALAGQDVYQDKNIRNKQIHRIVGTSPTLAAAIHRHRQGRPFNNPRLDYGYAENFLYMMDRMANPNYRPHPTLVRALDILFILHADHELNCSTAAMRHLTSSGVDVYSCVAGATAALYGPLHGGANEAVLRMLEGIGDVSNIPAFIEGVKTKKVRLMGFGHRVYKNYDPRAKIVRSIASDVFRVLGKEPLVEVATALEKYALEDPYFIKRNLYPNVDFYSGVIYKAMGIPTDFFPVLFAVPRSVGWIAHWNEFLDDKENKIVRPRQVYLGPTSHDYTPMSSRPSDSQRPIGNLSSPASAESGRRLAGQ